MKNPEKFKKKLEYYLRQEHLTTYGFCLALVRAKKLYEALYPQTIKGYYMKKTRKKGQKKLPKRGLKREKKIKSFAQSAALIKRVSERTIRNKIAIGKAIETILMSKKGNLIHSEILRYVEEKIKIKSIEEKKNECLKLINMDNFCIECLKVRAAPCPHCNHQILACLDDLKGGMVILKLPNSRACNKFEN